MEETVNVTEAMVAFQNAISDLQGEEEQGKRLTGHKTAEALRKMDQSSLLTAQDLQKMRSTRHNKNAKHAARRAGVAKQKQRGNVYL